MNSQSIEKQIINWNVYTFQNLTAFVDLINRAEKKQPPKQHDYKLRDFFFKPTFQLFGIKEKATFIDYAAGIAKNFTSYNRQGYMQSLAFENHIQKHQFWNQIYKKYIKNEKDYEAKRTVQSIVWTYRIIPLSLFLFGAAIIMRISGIHKMSRKKQSVGLIAAVIICDIFVRAKKSSEIFYLIPPLADEELEAQRVDIMNKSIMLDGKINQIEFKPKFVDELVEEADKQTNYEEKKLILETAGFTVIDRKDFVY